MYLGVVVVVYIIFAYYFVDWKNVLSYYSTVQYFIICNLLYNFVFYQHTLWRYKAVTVDWLNHSFIEFTFTFFIMPVVIMIYLRFFPKGNKRYLYVAIWVAYFTTIEYLFHKKGLFIYENNWNLLWSCLFNMILFIVLRIHFKSPIKAIIVSIPIIAILLFLFHPALSELK